MVREGWEQDRHELEKRAERGRESEGQLSDCFFGRAEERSMGSSPLPAVSQSIVGPSDRRPPWT